MLEADVVSFVLFPLELLTEKHSNNFSVTAKLSLSISCSGSLSENCDCIDADEDLGGVGGLGDLIRILLYCCDVLAGDLPLLREFLGGDGILGLCSLGVECLALLLGCF